MPFPVEAVPVFLVTVVEPSAVPLRRMSDPRCPKYSVPAVAVTVRVVVTVPITVSPATSFIEPFGPRVMLFTPVVSFPAVKESTPFTVNGFVSV